MLPVRLNCLGNRVKKTILDNTMIGTAKKPFDEIERWLGVVMSFVFLSLTAVPSVPALLGKHGTIISATQTFPSLPYTKQANKLQPSPKPTNSASLSIGPATVPDIVAPYQTQHAIWR